MSEWEKLWSLWDKGEVDPFALVTCFPDFIKKIRAEGGKLKEKAEKWDELTKTLPSKSLLEKTNNCRVAESKLEAIKSLVEKGPSTDDWQYIDDLMGKLMNILESSDFTTNHDKEDKE